MTGRAPRALHSGSRWRSAAAVAAALVAGGGRTAVGIAALVAALGGTMSAPALRAQGSGGAAAVGALVAGLGTTGRVLLIGAHPDDEDTNLITWLARGRQVETAYLSLTRGDGGQNLIGPELGEALGVIRTQELLAARRIDGGRQYFTRAFDFGFSKDAEETLTHWPADSIFGDVIRVVRAFRPHVIVAVFSGTPRDGHGHHQLSGRWAREAFDAAADTVRFPAASHGVPWTVAKFYRSARAAPQEATLRFNAGTYDPLLGRSWAEVAAESRSQHRSQGFGALQPKGVLWGHLRREAARAGPADPHREQSLFDGVDTTWTRLARRVADGAARARLDSVDALVRDVRTRWRAEAPEPVVAPLAQVVRLLRLVQESLPLGGALTEPLVELHDALQLTRWRAERALLLAAAISVEATAPRAVLPVREPAKRGVNDSLPVAITIHNRGPVPVTVHEARVEAPRPPWPMARRDPSTGDPAAARDTARDTLPDGSIVAPDSALVVPGYAVAYGVTTPWWLVDGRDGDWFRAPVGEVDEAERQARAALRARATVDIAGVPVEVRVPIVHRYADPVLGERQLPVQAVPGIVIGLDHLVAYLRADVPVTRELRVHLRSAYPDSAPISVSLHLPEGLAADSADRRRVLVPGAPEATVVFRLRGRVPPGRHELGAIARHEGRATTRGDYVVAYDHVTPQRLYVPSGMWLATVPVRLPARARVGYVPGVADAGLEALRQLDVPVERLDPAVLGAADLSRYTAIMVGPRAYETSDALVRANPRLLEYARRGGTLVVQYGAQDMNRYASVLPYPMTWTRPAARVTVEASPVTVLQAGHPLLTHPNRIGADDWSGWVQERATYMPSTIAPPYRPVVALADPGETVQSGGLLAAPLGRGRYVYVTLALFRQWAAGVPGAARLLANLIAPVEGVGVGGGRP